MLAEHFSRDSRFRQPFGAVSTDTLVRLAVRIDTQEDTIHSVYCCYAYGLERFHESRLRMNLLPQPEPAAETPGQGRVPLWLECECPMPSEPAIFFYWFEIHVNENRIWLTSNHETMDGGSRSSTGRPHYLPGEALQPLPFQITVYDAAFHIPDWLPGSVMYQIFPDRFARASDFSLPEAIARFDLPERIWHEDWNADVDISGKPETGYLACDFFGGSLRGIREKLDYIAGMGTDIIYLNPIFKARSNHRYDTGDYEVIDPILGTLEDFRILCDEAQKRGIRIILDGVFSHTGADSRYFNKMGRYPETGAFQEASGDSPSDFGSWYTFHRKGPELFYDSWWGFPDLPSVNEHDLIYRHYMTGKNGIIRRWLKAGASGWRLDVSDELPDDFLRDVRRAVKEQSSQAIIMGEVWEDASRKISYGQYRDFLLGRTHDSLMGYPFRNALISWLARHHDAGRMFNELETIRENYPLASFYSNMNLISSHDIPRAITAIAGQPDPGSRETQRKTRLSASARRRGEQLLQLAFLFQIAYPGVAALYYGDETAMEGYRDPFNRRTFPWGHENRSLQNFFARAGSLRRKLPVLRTGFYECLLTQEDVFVMRRFLHDGADVFGKKADGSAQVLAMFNRSGEIRTFTLQGRTVELFPYEGRLEYPAEHGIETFRTI